MRVGQGTLDALDSKHIVKVNGAVIVKSSRGVGLHLELEEESSGRKWVWTTFDGRLTELAQNELDPPHDPEGGEE